MTDLSLDTTFLETDFVIDLFTILYLSDIKCYLLQRSVRFGKLDNLFKHFKLKYIRYISLFHKNFNVPIFKCKKYLRIPNGHV